MTNTTGNSSESQRPAKTLTLESLIPTKKEVGTSIGPVFVRKALRSDWPVLAPLPAQDMGLEVVRLLSSRVEDKKDRSGLTHDDLQALDQSDLKGLANAIADHNQWGVMQLGANLKALGEKAAAAMQKNHEQSQAAIEEMRQSLSSSYGFLGSSALETLQKQMADMSKIHRDVFNLDPLGTPGRFGETLSEPVVKPHFDPIDIRPLMPEFGDTPLGRATLEGVEKTRETAERMEKLADIVAGLNQTLIKDVLPAWFSNVKEGQADAERAAKQAARSLGWTKWAVIVSVVVTVIATASQVYVSLVLDQGSSAQQARTESILREQLQSQKELIENEKHTQELLREQVTGLQLINEKQALSEELLRKQITSLRRLYEQNSRSEASVLKAIEQKAAASSSATK